MERDAIQTIEIILISYLFYILMLYAEPYIEYEYYYFIWVCISMLMTAFCAKFLIKANSLSFSLLMIGYMLIYICSGVGYTLLINRDMFELMEGIVWDNKINTTQSVFYYEWIMVCWAICYGSIDFNSYFNSFREFFTFNIFTKVGSKEKQ